RLIGPVLRRAAGSPVVCGNLLFKIDNIGLFGAPGMLKQSSVPDIMKITGTAATLGRPELHNMYVVAAARLSNGVQGLMNIANKLDDKLERFYALFLWCFPVGQSLLEH